MPRSSLAEESYRVYESYESCQESCFGRASDQAPNPHYVPLRLGGQTLSAGCSKSSDGVSRWRPSHSGPGNTGHLPAEHPMHLTLSRSLHSLITGRAIWAAHLQRTLNTSAKQSQFSKAAKCILNCRAEWQASSAVTFICTPGSVRLSLSRYLSCWVRKRRLKMRSFFLPHVAKSFSSSFILSSSWTVSDWLLLTNPVSWLSAEKPQEGKSPP